MPNLITNMSISSTYPKNVSIFSSFFDTFSSRVDITPRSNTQDINQTRIHVIFFSAKLDT